MTLTWTAPTSGGTVAYFIYRGTGAKTTAASTNIGSVLSTGTQYVDSSSVLTVGTSYHYAVAASHPTGSPTDGGTVPSDFLTVTIPNPPGTTAPDAPVLTATLSSDKGSVTLTWTIPADNGAAITHYQIQRAAGTSGGTFANVGDAITDLNARSYTDTSPAAGTYRYRVRAVNSVGNGDSTPASVTFSEPPTTNNADFDRLNQAVLPRIAAAVVAQTAGVISGRIGQSGGSPRVAGDASSFTTSSFTTSSFTNRLGNWLGAYEQTNNDLNLRNLLPLADFVIPLSDTQNRGALGTAIWGHGDYRKLRSDGGLYDWDGDLFSAHLGADFHARPNLLLGAAVSWSQTKVDYNSSTDSTKKGTYAMNMASINPYLGWSSADGLMDVWATLGYGTGELEIKPQGGVMRSADVQSVSAAVGSSGHLLGNSTTALRGKGEIQQSATQADANASGTLSELKVRAHRARLALEGRHSRVLPSGARSVGTLEVGARLDGGDGETGGGMEFVAGWTRSHNGLTWQVSGRGLVGREGYAEWGVSGLIRREAGKDGQGLGLVVRPGYGDTGGGVRGVWEHGLSVVGDVANDDVNDVTSRYAPRMEVNMGYGLSLPHLRGRLTPYGEATLGETRDGYGFGVRWELGGRMKLDLGNERQGHGDAILLKGEVRF